MISICTTIYNQPDNLEVFIRSLVGNATDKNFEIVVVDDENSCTKKLKELQKEFPQIKIVPHPKAERIKFIEGLISFYKENNIFNKKIIKEMEKTLSLYKRGKISLWLPMPHNFNLAAKVAKGETLVFMPADYLIFFDLTKLDVGHPDWVDVTVIEPYPDFSVLKGFKKQEEFKAFTEEIMDKAKQFKALVIPAQHGSRVITRRKYEEVGGFDDRWFVRALGEDLFNSQCGVVRLANTLLFRTNTFIGNIKPDGDKYFTYLSPRYSINSEDHSMFVDKIKEWMGGAGNET